MPIDKFGRHFLQSKIQREVPPAAPILTAALTSDPFYICEPSRHHSKCVLSITGAYDKKKSISFFVLENGSTKYTIPIDGKIESIELIPSNAQIVLNSGNGVSAHELANVAIYRGDTFTFLTSFTYPTDTFYAQIVVQCPITKDE